jgi:serine/threonine-protein kinase
MTETGLSLGTPGYMSPEQATGDRLLDARSDVYSLGCLLYEMLVGEPPHTGPTVQAVIAAVVTKTPERVTARRATVPAHIDAAVHQALAKLPADRFSSAEAFARALADPGFSVAQPAATAAMAVPRMGGNRTVLLLGALSTVLAFLAGWGWLRPRPTPPVNRFSVLLPPKEELQPVGAGGGGRLAISPNGRRLVYVGPGGGETRLWLRELDQLHATPISGTEGGASPFFSPDGRQLGFIKSGRTVRILSLEGGPPLTLTDSANSTAGDWGSDGYVYFETTAGLGRIRATGGAVEPVFALSEKDREIGAEWPIVLPHATGLVFRLRHAGQAPTDFDIVGMKLPAGKPQALMRGIYARYSPSGHLLVVTADGKLLAVPFDPAKLAVTGPPIALVEGLRSNPFAVDLALSTNGTLAYTSGGSAPLLRAFWVTREGVGTPVDSTWDPQGTINSLALSPNGEALAVGLARDGKEDIWVKQLPRGPFSRITFGDTAHVRPSWSSDGRSVVFITDRSGTAGGGLPAMKRADGTGAAQLLLSSPYNFGQTFESRDGRWLVLRRVITEPGNGDILAVRTGDTALVPLLTTGAREISPSLSPDGRWLAYASNESGTSEIYVRPFPDVASARWQISLTGGTEPLWAHSGRELFYLNGRGEMVTAEVKPGPVFQIGQQRVLFSAAPYLNVGAYQSYNVSPDDRRFVMEREGGLAQGSELILAENWFEELKARGRK